MKKIIITLTTLISFSALADCQSLIQDEINLINTKLRKSVSLAEGIVLGSSTGAVGGVIVGANQDPTSECNSKPAEFVTIGAVAGTAIAVSTFYINKAVLKQKLKKYKILQKAFKSPMDDQIMAKAADILMKKSDADKLDDLRRILADYNDLHCGRPHYEISIGKMKKFVKQALE